MTHDPSNMDKPFYIAALAVVWLEAVDVITALSEVSKLVIQLTIGALTIIYLVHKIRNIKKQNSSYDQESQSRQDNI